MDIAVINICDLDLESIYEGLHWTERFSETGIARFRAFLEKNNWHYVSYQKGNRYTVVAEGVAFCKRFGLVGLVIEDMS